LTKETLLVITGMVFILAGILFIEKFLPVVMNTPLSNENRIFLKVVDIYLIVAGLLTILYRKSIDLKNILLFGIASLLYFTLFLSYDFYRAYSIFDHPPQIGVENSIQNVHVKDRYLGWKPKADGIGRHTHIDYDVTYKMDSNGFKKINNSEKPDLSIYFFGDSMTFGVGVQNKDTFPNIIKDRYLSRQVNVYNAGVMGYGITQMFKRFLDLEAFINAGDLVIFTPISDDINRHVNHPGAVFVMNSFRNLVPIDTYPVYDKGVIKIKDIKMESSFSKKIKAVPFIAPYTGMIWGFLYNKIFLADVKKQAIEMIEIVRQKIENRGGKFLLIFLPIRNERLNHAYNEDISGFHYFDIIQFFPFHEKELDNLFFDYDKHYNVNGHELVAKAIVETLIEEKILDKKYLEADLKE
jgi:hypothetical protein